MNSSQWVADFLRQMVLHSGPSSDISTWAPAFLEAIKEAKPDQEVQVFGVSRVPGMPNYLLASSSESLSDEGPVQIQVTEKTADLFLLPTTPGIRMLQQDWPMTVLYDAENPEGKTERRELSFYDAICFDGMESSIVLGLILNEGTLAEFLTQEEISELLPIFHGQGIPLYELFNYRKAHKRLEMEVELMTGLVRETSPELLNLSNPQGDSKDSATDGMQIQKPAKGVENMVLTPVFFQHAAQELKSALDKVLSCPEVQMSLNETDAGLGLEAQTSPLIGTLEHQRRLIKNLGNIAALLQPNVRPHQDVIGLQKFMQEIEPVAKRCATRHGVRIDVDSHTRNIYAAGDQQSLLRIVKRLLEFHFTLCRGGQCWIRVDEDPNRGDQGFVMLEIEDDGKNPANIPIGTLLQRIKKYGQEHPRLKNGGAILYYFISIFLEKSGGEFRLGFGLNGNFAAQFLLPRVSRAEMERHRGKAAVASEGLD